jgi:Zn-ribbon-containing, possibly nucleic-acid-binding protein (DUF2310)
VVSPEPIDPYWKLRPRSATPEDEQCTCADRPPVVLQCNLSSNPIACIRCNGVIPPERIGFAADLAERIAFWRDIHDALYILWLDSSDYEPWAITQLADPNGRINVDGIEIVQALNNHHRTYFWWFQDTTSDDFVAWSQCPRCSANLVKRFGHLVCEPCSILVPNG